MLSPAEDCAMIYVSIIKGTQYIQVPYISVDNSNMQMTMSFHYFFLTRNLVILHPTLLSVRNVMTPFCHHPDHAFPCFSLNDGDLVCHMSPGSNHSSDISAFHVSFDTVDDKYLGQNWNKNFIANFDVLSWAYFAWIS